MSYDSHNNTSVRMSRGTKYQVQVGLLSSTEKMVIPHVIRLSRCRKIRMVVRRNTGKGEIHVRRTVRTFSPRVGATKLALGVVNIAVPVLQVLQASLL